MKTTNQFFSAMLIMLLLALPICTLAQEDSKRPQYVTVTTMHWNMDNEDFNMDEWKAVEKEYLDKVTMKNEYIMGMSFHLHMFTADNTEIKYVQVFASWEDIDKASDRNGELEKEAWPNEDDRKAFMKKRMAYYANEHSDEIYATMPGAKLMGAKPDKDMITYVRVNHFAFPEDGSREEFEELNKGYIDNLIMKNEYIKAYYPHVHAWGADRTEAVEAFVVESLADLDKMFERNQELSKEAWPEEEARKARGKKVGKYFTGVHGDYIYQSVHELSK
ncbi:hypothetical protein [Aestuariivivens insulae]|uniref:hypothetical protein n=1 Tax=Aestuariivivens insulae TaxID=1621988 RepID=UPI001F59A991|nr:hypothetical protein [Aestuariivivens insulae]